MSKRQVKISIANIESHFTSEKVLSFIMRNGSVILARPIHSDQNLMTVENTRKKNMKLLLSDIEEIWTEV